MSAQKRVAGVVFNFINQDRAQKYGGEYYYGKSYEKYYSQ
jgi:Mrp family chromosome partitioning ATPase